MTVALQRLDLLDPDDPRAALSFLGEASVSGGELRVAPGDVIDLGTWLNAAPVAWWRHVLGVDQFTLELAGQGSLQLWEAHDGKARLRSRHDITDSAQISIESGRATWLWLRIEGGTAGSQLRQATWSVPGLATSERTARASVVMPTFAREADAVSQAARFLAMPHVARVFAIDQAGTLHEHPEFSRLRDEAGERLVLLSQDNLGGSGGYARGMLASLDHPDDPVYLSDDDALTTSESLRRLLILQQIAPQPIILGTSLLEADDPGRVAAVAEHVDRSTFFWGPADGLGEPLDVIGTSPATWQALSPQASSDYTGWWGTLLPPRTVSRVGLPAPYFLKWDDAEYGLRAQAHDIPSYTVPGISVWHPTWAEKQTASGWSSLPLHRNRIVTALSYGATPRVLLDSLIHQVKHVLSLQYPTAKLWNAALDDVLAGPHWLGSDLRVLRPRAQALADSVHEVASSSLASRAREPQRIKSGALLCRVLRGVTGLWRSVAVGRAEVLRVSSDESHWTRTVGADAVVLTDSTGSAPTAILRRPATSRALLAEALRLHVRALLRWRDLSKEYSVALGRTTTAQAWQAVIGLARDVHGGQS